MNEDNAKYTSEMVLDLIRRSNGRLGWYEIARSLGADKLEERGEVFLELRALENLGVIRRASSDGAVRF